MSSHFSPKNPFSTQRTLSPLSTRLAMAASIPKVPLPESIKGIPSVTKSFFCSSRASSKPVTNSLLT